MKIQEESQLDDVEKADSVTAVYRKLFTDIWEVNSVFSENRKAHGVPCTTIHYLTDGILKIEYDVLESGDIVIADIEYSEDYILTDLWGDNVNYTILDIDLPK